MKRQVQQIGVRKWFGDDFITIQDELLAVLEGFFGEYGQQFILSGCDVDGTTISPGIVGLIDGDGFHLCRFDGQENAVFPMYLYPVVETENRAYLDNEVKPIAKTYKVASAGADGGSYLQLKQDGTSARFFDAIQTANRRFVTDAEKSTYLGQAASAISTLRNGVASDFDTLLKIATAIASKAPLASPVLTGTPLAPTAANGTNTTQLATTAFVQSAIGLLINSAPGALDTLNELATALGNDPNFATTITNALALKAPLASPALTGTPTAPTAATGTNSTQIATTAFVAAAIAAGGYTLTKATIEAVLTGVITTHSHSVAYTNVADTLKTYTVLANGAVDLSAYAGGKITLTANTAFTFSGFELNKTYLLTVTANGYTPSFSDGTKHVAVEGNAELGTSGVFYISLTCIDATAGSEKLLTMIMKGV